MKTILLADVAFLVDWGIKILAAVGGIFGSALGIYNFNHARKKEKGERESEERDWQLYVQLRSDMEGSGGNVLAPDNGSDQHRWAERMVERGKLERTAEGSYYKFPSGL